MKLTQRLAGPVAIALWITASAIAPTITVAQTKAEKKVEEVIEVFGKIMSNPKTEIPADLLKRSQGIAIFEDVIQAGLIFGGRRGTGVILLRQPDGEWSYPAFVSITGGSFGLQLGGKSSDIVLVFPNRKTVNEVLSSSFKLGGSISGTAGPVAGSAVTPEKGLSDEPIYTYVRSSGLFGGVALDGSKVGFHKKHNREFYGQTVTAREIFRGAFLSAPEIADQLIEAIEDAENATFSRF
jgi:lipid-binding SYLF domain-containing protein